MSGPREKDLTTLIDAIAVLAHELRGPAVNPFGLDLSRAQMDVLFALSRVPDTTVKNLAGALTVSSASISQILVPLEDAHLITREPDPSDGRSRRLGLTDAARTRVDEFQNARIRAFAPRFDFVGDADLASAARTLGTVIDQGRQDG